MARKKDKIILIGGGGHCKSCIDVIEQQGIFEIAGIVERQDHGEDKDIFGYPILGIDEELPKLKETYPYAMVSVGQIKTPSTRIRIFQKLLDLDFQLPTLISPFAYVSRHAYIERGTIVMHHALVNAGARIGANCIINSKALVEHDAEIGHHCHIATGAIVNGGVKVGAGSFFGSGAVSKQFISISPNSFIKANNTVKG